MQKETGPFQNVLESGGILRPPTFLGWKKAANGEIQSRNNTFVIMYSYHELRCVVLGFDWRATDSFHWVLSAERRRETQWKKLSDTPFFLYFCQQHALLEPPLLKKCKFWYFIYDANFCNTLLGSVWLVLRVLLSRLTCGIIKPLCMVLHKKPVPAPVAFKHHCKSAIRSPSLIF